MVIVNTVARYDPPIINGLMPSGITINGLTYNPVRSGCVLNLPLYHSSLSPSSFKSLDVYKHSCSVFGALWTPQGRSLDGVDDYVDCGNNAILNFTNGEFSIEAWIQVTSFAASRMIFNRGEIDAAGYFFICNSTGDVQLSTNQSGARQNTSSNAGDITLNTWYHVVATRNGAVVRLYRNGVDVTKTSAAHVDPASSTRVAEIGIHKAANWPFAGLIGEVRVYNRSLTPLEIQHNYLATKWRYR